MHKMLIVIGDDPDAQVHASGVSDWWAIGGRYTGQLPLKPGRSGKTYGDAAPAIEARLQRYMPDGVDQARAEDVDIDQLTAVGLVRDSKVLMDLSFDVTPAVIRDQLGQVPGDALLTVVDAHY
jgi:hypothetical protein